MRTEERECCLFPFLTAQSTLWQVDGCSSTYSSARFLSSTQPLVWGGGDGGTGHGRVKDGTRLETFLNCDAGQYGL